jgi:Na+/melibiose symporter-like transporter
MTDPTLAGGTPAPPSFVEPPPMPARIKWFYGFGAMANGAYAPLAGIVLFYFNQVVGAPAHLVSLALGVMVLIDALWDPLIGQFSDRLRSPWGRRHPLIYIAIPLIVIALHLRWNPPPNLSDPLLFAFILLTGLGVNFALSLYEVPSNALAPELAPRYHDRTVLQGYRWTFGVCGGALISVLMYGVFLRSTPEYPMGQLNPAGYPPLITTIALVTAGVILVSTLGTHHTIPSLHKPERTSASLRDQLRDAGETFRNWNFGVAFVANVIAGLGAGLGGLTIYFATYLWELGPSALLVMSFVGFLSAPLAALAATPLSRRFGKKQACMGLFFASVAVGNAPMLLRLLGLFLPNDSSLLLPSLFAFALVAGICSTGGFIIVSSMVADIVEDSQAKTGRRSEALLGTAESFPNRIMTSLSALLPGLLLTLVGFPEQARPGEVPDAIIYSLAWIVLPLGAAISLASIATWSFFRIGEQEHARNLASIR